MMPFRPFDARVSFLFALIAWSGCEAPKSSTTVLYRAAESPSAPPTPDPVVSPEPTPVTSPTPTPTPTPSITRRLDPSVVDAFPTSSLPTDPRKPLPIEGRRQFACRATLDSPTYQDVNQPANQLFYVDFPEAEPKNDVTVFETSAYRVSLKTDENSLNLSARGKYFARPIEELKADRSSALVSVVVNDDHLYLAVQCKELYPDLNAAVPQPPAAKSQIACLGSVVNDQDPSKSVSEPSFVRSGEGSNSVLIIANHDYMLHAAFEGGITRMSFLDHAIPATVFQAEVDVRSRLVSTTVGVGVNTYESYCGVF